MFNKMRASMLMMILASVNSLHAYADSTDATEKKSTTQIEQAPEFQRFRLIGGMSYLYRSNKALQPSDGSEYNAFPRSRTRGDSMHLLGALGSISYFALPFAGVSINASLGNGYMVNTELELVPTNLGSHDFDFGFLAGLMMFESNTNAVSLVRFTVGTRLSLNFNSRFGVATAFRFAPFFSTAGNTVDLFSLGDLAQTELGLFIRF